MKITFVGLSLRLLPLIPPIAYYRMQIVRVGGGVSGDKDGAAQREGKPRQAFWKAHSWEVASGVTTSTPGGWDWTVELVYNNVIS